MKLATAACSYKCFLFCSFKTFLGNKQIFVWLFLFRFITWNFSLTLYSWAAVRWQDCCSCDFYTIQSRLLLLTSEASCQSSLSEHYILSYLTEVLTLLSKQLNLLLHSSVSDFKSYKFLFYIHTCIVNHLVSSSVCYFIILSESVLYELSVWMRLV